MLTWSIIYSKTKSILSQVSLWSIFHTYFYYLYLFATSSSHFLWQALKKNYFLASVIPERWKVFYWSFAYYRLWFGICDCREWVDRVLEDCWSFEAVCCRLLLSFSVVVVNGSFCLYCKGSLLSFSMTFCQN